MKMFSKSKKNCTCNQYEDFVIICCNTLKERLNNCKIGIVYDKQTRYFAIKSPILGSHRIPHCPWCGTKFPKNLIDEWYEILEKEYGITDPENKEQSKRIPAEFQTDEWWKKRGL